MFGFGLRLGIQSTASGGGGTAPGQAQFLTAGQPADTTVPLTWAAPSSGGAPTGYTVQYRAYPGGGSWTTFGTSADASETVTGLTANTFYEFQIIATNGAGNGPASSSVVALTEQSAAWQSAWTFSRASSKTALNYNGLVQSFASGVKAQTDMGLSLDRGLTNSCTQPYDLSAWTPAAAAAGVGGQSGPDGLTGAYLGQATAGSAQHGYDCPTFTVTTGGTQSCIIDMKMGTNRYMQIAYASAGFGANAYINIDMLRGEATVIGSLFTASAWDIIPLFDGWLRIRVTAVATANGQAQPFIRFIDSATSARNQTYTATGNETFYFGGCTVVPTGYANGQFSGTRAQDSLTMTKVQSGGYAFFFDVIVPRMTINNPTLFQWSDSLTTPANYIDVKLDTTTGNAKLRKCVASAVTDLITESQATYWPRRISGAVHYNPGTTTFTLIIGGKTAGSVVSATPTGMQYLRLGSDVIPTGAVTAGSYWRDWQDLDPATTISALRTMTSLPAYGTAQVIYAADATYQETTTQYQGIPGIWVDSNGRTWAAWDRRYQQLSSYSERPGMNLVVAYSDNDTTWTEVCYLVPGLYDAWMDQVHIWEATDGSLWILYTLIGGGVIHDGRYGVWVAKINDPSSATPTIDSQKRICDGIAMKPFLADGVWYLNVDVWPDAIVPVQPGVTAGKYIYEIDVANVDVTLVETVPVGTNQTYDETSCVELSNGDILARWRRTGTGAQQATLVGGIGGAWGANSVVSGTNTDSRSVLYKGPSNTIIWAYNASAAGSRTNMTIRVSTDDMATEPYSVLIDSRTNVSYPDVWVDQTTGDIKLIYDRERGSTTGTGAREVIMARGFTVAQIIAGTASPTLTVISDGSP